MMSTGQTSKNVNIFCTWDKTTLFASHRPVQMEEWGQPRTVTGSSPTVPHIPGMQRHLRGCQEQLPQNSILTRNTCQSLGHWGRGRSGANGPFDKWRPIPIVVTILCHMYWMCWCGRWGEDRCKSWSWQQSESDRESDGARSRTRAPEAASSAQPSGPSLGVPGVTEHRPPRPLPSHQAFLTAVTSSLPEGR